MITVSSMESGAGSVLVSARPALPRTRSTSGNCLDRPIARLQQPLRLGDRNPRHRRRHVEERPLVERRHELGAEAVEHRDGQEHEREGGGDHGPLPAQRPADDRLVGADQDAADRMMLLGSDAADQHGVGGAAEPRRPEVEAADAREQHAQRRVEREDERRGHDHRQRFRVGERLEQPSFLRLERQHRQERHRDHEQREEAGRRHFLHRLDHRRSRVGLRPEAAGFLQLLVRLFDDDDRRVDELAHRDRDSAERHDVDGEPHPAERDERDQHRHRDRDQRDERARHVPQEQQHDEDDREDDLDERPADVVDRSPDEHRAIVDRHDLDALRQAGLRSGGCGP